jgi:hypothetical protein
MLRQDESTLMKTSMKCLSLIATLAIMSLAANAMADTIAMWTFETSKPSTAGPIVAETGTGTGMAAHAGVTAYSAPAGNGSANSWSANVWAVGDYFQFEVSTVVYFGESISWDQTGSGTGPGDFVLQYSDDGTNFTTFGSQYSIFSPAVSWNSATNVSTTHFSQDLSSITALDGQATVFFRLKDNSTRSVGNGLVGTAGTDRVDNVLISVGIIPEPSAFLLGAIGVGLFGLLGSPPFRRKNN